MDRIRVVIKRVATRLIRQYGATFVALGNKETEGQRTRKPAIVFAVRKKRNVRANAIPRELRLASGSGSSVVLATDVVEAPESSRLLGFVDGGDRILAGVLIREGTIGLVVLDRDEVSAYALTNAHVLTRVGFSAIGAEVFSDSLLPHGSRIGFVKQHSELRRNLRHNVDLGVIALDDPGVSRPWVVPSLPNGRVQQFRSVSESAYGGAYDQFYYVSGNEIVYCTNPRYVPQASFRTRRSGGTSLRYVDFYMLTSNHGGRPLPGHSGALLARNAPGENGVIGCGLIFGGAGSTVYAIPWSTINRYLPRMGVNI